MDSLHAPATNFRVEALHELRRAQIPRPAPRTTDRAQIAMCDSEE